MHPRGLIRTRTDHALAGFTMVELMGIVVMLGLLSGLIWVSYQAIVPHTELNSSVRELGATLHEARSDAISRNAEFLVEYYFEDTPEHPRGYRVVTPFRADSSDGGLAAFEEERFARSWHALPESVHFAAITVNGKEYYEGQVVVRFDPMGSASDHLIVLKQDPYDTLYTIEVLALTGLIRFHDGEFKREYPKDTDFKK